MKAYQIDALDRITGLEEEPTGPSRDRIQQILYSALNQSGYSFQWKQVRQQPYQGILNNGSSSIDLLIYVWRISNEGKGRKDLNGKRIQIADGDEIGFQRPITSTEKTLLLGVYERDKDFPIIAAWDVERNRVRGSNKSCFVKLDDFVEARRTGFFSAEDNSGNPVYAMTANYLAIYAEQIRTKIFLKPDEFYRKVRNTSVKRAVTSTESILKRITDLSETEKQAMVTQRIGQGAFKDLLMIVHDEKCCVCGLDFPPLLVGSHIKQWSKSTDKEKLDGNNGLLLCVMHDALFDKFLISFEDDGKIIYSDLLTHDLLDDLNLTENIYINVPQSMKPYLQWHRKRLKKK